MINGFRQKEWRVEGYLFSLFYFIHSRSIMHYFYNLNRRIVKCYAIVKLTLIVDKSSINNTVLATIEYNKSSYIKKWDE